MTPAPDVAAIAKRLSDKQRWVPGYEGHYYLDDRGEIYSHTRTFARVNRGRQQIVRVPGRRLVQCLNRNGYPFVRLYMMNKGRTFEVHRLVCRAFHGEPRTGEEACHINGDRTNPAESNLRWASRAENHADKRVHGTHLTGCAVAGAKLTPDLAREVCGRALSGESMRALAKEFKVNEAAVRKIRNGTLWADHTIAIRAHILSQDHRHD